MISGRLERRVEAARTIGLGALTEELIGGLQEELEFLHEAKVGTALGKNRAADVGISVPRVHPTLSTDGILVMEEVVGRSVGEPEALDESPVPRPQLARRVLASYIGQILDDGLFHADPHPGNMLIDAEGTIWLLDFGSVGRLDARALNGLRGIALGVATNEPGLLARAARDMTGDDGAVDLRSLEADMGVALGQLDSPGGMDPRLIRDVLSVMRRHDMRPPSSVTLLARSLLTIEGTLRLIDPGFSLTATSREVVLSDHSDAIGTPQEILQREALRALPSLRTLPEHVETLANQLRSGRLSVQTELFAGASRDVVDNWVDRIVIAATGGLGAVAGAIVLFAAVGDRRQRRGPDDPLDPRVRRAHRRVGPADARRGPRVATDRGAHRVATTGACSRSARPPRAPRASPTAPPGAPAAGTPSGRSRSRCPP